MSNIPKPEDEKNLEFDIRYQPDMVLSGSLDATVPEMNNLQLELGDETYDLLGAQTGDQILELLSEDLTAAEEGKVLTVVGEAEPVTTYYLPEQTITLTTGQGTVTGADFSGLSDGDKATLTLTIGGKTATTEGELWGTAFAFGKSSDIDSTGAVSLSAQDVGFTVLEMSGEKTATLSISATTEGEKTYSAQWAEAGVEAVYYVNVTETGLDKNFAEINEAYRSGKHVVVVDYQEGANESFTALFEPLVVLTSTNGFMVACYDFTQSSMVMYSSETETGPLIAVT